MTKNGLEESQRESSSQRGALVNAPVERSTVLNAPWQRPTLTPTVLEINSRIKSRWAKKWSSKRQKGPFTDGPLKRQRTNKTVERSFKAFN